MLPHLHLFVERNAASLVMLPFFSTTIPRPGLTQQPMNSVRYSSSITTSLWPKNVAGFRIDRGPLAKRATRRDARETSGPACGTARHTEQPAAYLTLKRTALATNARPILTRTLSTCGAVILGGWLS